MRLVSYNILDGGEGRADLLAEVIEAQRPDVLALVECESPEVLEGLAARLDMDVVHAAGNERSAAALLSRWPIRDSVNHTPGRPKLSKALLEATVLDPAGVEWTVGVAHLHARAAEADEQRREAEISEVLSAFAAHRKAGRPHLLAGDFNANSPAQQIDPAALHPKARQQVAHNGGFLPRRVVQKLLSAGYVDTLHAQDPAYASTAGTFTTEHPGQRVDYVFAFGVPAGRIKSAWVDQADPAPSASDHYPVGVEIEPK